MIKPTSKIKEIKIFIADSDFVLRMEKRLNEIVRVLRKFVKIRCLACKVKQTNKIFERSHILSFN